MAITELDHRAHDEIETAPLPRDADPGHAATGATNHPLRAAGLSGLATLSVAALSACGGSEGGAVDAADAGGTRTKLAAGVEATLTREQASRFLSQAAFGGTRSDIEKLQGLTIPGWLDEQFNKPLNPSYVDAITKGPDSQGMDKYGRNNIEGAIWRRLVSFPDVLRQRVTLALSNIFVININSLTALKDGFGSAAFMDVLERNAFGNYRDLLVEVSKTAAMGTYLTFRKNKKADPTVGSQPDENYARELMQLFAIGLFQLNIDGTPVLIGGKPVETYTQDDVMGLARVFTGWDMENDGSNQSQWSKPMLQVPKWHELGEKKFLQTSIPAGTDGVKSLGMAIDTLMKHPSMAPFIARQLIQRLVTSNPSPAYVERVARAFKGETSGAPNGDMKSTWRAILLDPEARSEANLSNLTFGKLREPLLRFVQWARTFELKADKKGLYRLDDLSSDVSDLGQSPLRSPSVFNFFRPGFVPSGFQGITAPEFQITTETSVGGYLNFMQDKIEKGIEGCDPNYNDLQPLANDAKKLIDEVNLLLAAGQLSAATVSKLVSAVNSISAQSASGRNKRIHAAVMLVMAAPEYLVQK